MAILDWYICFLIPLNFSVTVPIISEMYLGTCTSINFYYILFLKTIYIFIQD